MKTWVALLLLSSAAYAQQQQEDPVERSLQRIKDQLRDQPLTEEQATKARDILKRQNEDLRGILTDAQKTQLDQQGRGGGNNRGGQGNFTGFRGGAWYPSTDELKTQLSLTEDQVTKINEVRDGVRQNIRNFFQSRQRGGNPADEWNAFQEKSREESTKKIRDLLTDEQKPKFDETVKTFAANPPQNNNSGGGNRGRGGPSIDERVARVMADLKVEDAKEADAIKSVVKKVMEIMEKLDTYQRDARNKIDDASRNKELSDEAVGDRIGEIMKGMREIEKELSGARKELTEIVTNRQELELLRQRILR